MNGTDITLGNALILTDSGEDGVLSDVLDIERLLPHGFSLAEYVRPTRPRATSINSL